LEPNIKQIENLKSNPKLTRRKENKKFGKGFTKDE